MQSKRLWSLLATCAAVATVLGALMISAQGRRPGAETAARVELREPPATTESSNTHDNIAENDISMPTGTHAPRPGDDEPASDASPALPATPVAPRNQQAQRQPLPANELASLMRRKLSPATRREINQHLRPNNQPPRVVQRDDGEYIDLSDRASSVMIAIIDDNDNTVVADITQPIAIEQAAK